MGYGASPCHTTILNKELVHEFFQNLGMKLEFDKLEELYEPFSELLFKDEFVDFFESGEFGKHLNEYDDVSSSLEDAIVKVENFYRQLQEAEKVSGLYFYLMWVGDDGDRYDDLCDEFAIEVGNVYIKTEPAEKYKTYIQDASWVVYG